MHVCVCYEVGACTCVRPWSASAAVLTLLYCVSIFIHMGSSSRGQMLGNPQNQSWSHTIITAILIKVLNCDPLIFSQCWLLCSTVTTSITKLQPVINLHIIYMLPNQHTANPNPKITSTWTGKPLPLSNLNIFLPSPPILIWYNDDACFLHMSKLRYCMSEGVILNWHISVRQNYYLNSIWPIWASM